MRVANGATPTADDVATIARQNVGVKKSMNNLVELLEVVAD